MSQLPGVSIVRDPSDLIAGAEPVSWAVAQLRQALSGRGIAAREASRLEDVSEAERCVVVAGLASALAGGLLTGDEASRIDAPEALALASGTIAGRSALLAAGGDVRGLVYAVLELADRVVHAPDASEALAVERPILERPANQIRAVSRLFVSDVEDKAWLYDRDFWSRYLTMLISQRFNRVHLALGIGHDFVRNVLDAYFLFPYPFFLAVPGYDVRVVGLPDAERDRNLAALRYASDAAKACGLQFQLGLWMHAYEWVDSPHPNFTVEGVSPENHAAYCRDALRLLLAECPSIDGVTFRVHGESGVPEGSYDFWREVFQGVVQSGRRIEIDLHPKGVDREMIRVGLETGMPVNISPKYTAEHMGLPGHQASIRELERDSRPIEAASFTHKLMNLSAGALRYTRYGHADFLEEGREYGVYYRIWPGTQRLLLWGDPAMAAGYGRNGSFCGCLGVDLMEPLSFKGRRGSGLPGGRDAYADPSLKPSGGDFEKYLYTYRLFGRLLYNPDADPDAWRRYLAHEFGPAAPSVEAALASASRILPLVTTAYHPSAANNRYWPEVYTNMPIVSESRPHPYGDTAAPKRFGNVSPLDPELFSRVDEFAGEIVDGARSGKYSPLRVATCLQDFAESAARSLKSATAEIPDPSAPAFRRLAADVAIQSGLGLFFAHKLRAGVAHALYVRTGEVRRLWEAVEEYRAARSAWSGLADRATGVYVEDITVGGEACLRGHWSDRLAAIDADLEDMVAELEAATSAGLPAERALTPLADLDPAISPVEHRHVPPTSFRAGEPVVVELWASVVGGNQPMSACLRYRHVNQADTYEAVEMEVRDGRFVATIPGAYTDSRYPLQYYFVLRAGLDRAWLYPGLAGDLSNQAYFVVRQAR